MHSETIQPWLILPFVLLLGSIALLPLVAHTWWERHYPKVAAALAAIPLAYYLFVLRNLEHPLETLHDYLSFIVMIGSLFIVSGGIHIRVKGEATPWVNVLFLAIGAVLANLLGTTGASMILLRPYIRMNKYRITAYHIVFFIFIVSNVGGCLTPIGDPPLYLGFLKGVPFFWTLQHLWPMWMIGVGWLLAAFLFFDIRNFRKAPTPIREIQTAHETWRFDGLQNLGWMAVILGALFIQKPVFLREIIMIAAAAGSWFTTRKDIHEANHFTWHPIREVAILFAGIFISMMPVLQWLEQNAGHLGLRSTTAFYWASGAFSAVLDNAPTYLTFLSAGIGLFANDASVQHIRDLLQHTGGIILNGPAARDSLEGLQTMAYLNQTHAEAVRQNAIPSSLIQTAHLLTNHGLHIAAISIGAVFFGAFTYIGNGPNFMVKSIAHHAGIKTPSFFGFIFRYSLPILLPMLLIIGLIFFKS